MQLIMEQSRHILYPHKVHRDSLGSHLISNPVLTGAKEGFTVRVIDSLLVIGTSKLHNVLIELIRLTDTALQAA